MERERSTQDGYLRFRDVAKQVNNAWNQWNTRISPYPQRANGVQQGTSLE